MKAAVAVRRLFTTADFLARGGTRSQLRWGEHTGRLTMIVKGVYGEGDEHPSDLDIALARVLVSRAPAWGAVAGLLYGLDAVELPSKHRRRWTVPIDASTVGLSGISCTSALQTLVDLAEDLDDAQWEQALESALRMKLLAIGDLATLLPAMSKERRHGVGRIRRVLALRPVDAPPTESILETLMVQLARDLPGFPPPTRQYIVLDRRGEFVARVDLCWPELGIFLELDGMQHKGQPKYDARRQTRVIAATGWLCGRFTWDEVVFNKRVAQRALLDLLTQARSQAAAV